MEFRSMLFKGQLLNKWPRRMQYLTDVPLLSAIRCPSPLFRSLSLRGPWLTHVRTFVLLFLCFCCEGLPMAFWASGLPAAFSPSWFQLCAHALSHSPLSLPLFPGEPAFQGGVNAGTSRPFLHPSSPSDLHHWLEVLRQVHAHPYLRSKPCRRSLRHSSQCCAEKSMGPGIPCS